ncbi:hypothetical protein NC652_010745 [Populus alba x Populus x berolinensis]|nr:hypothetical protein NC652_010745 [Populus alba x Populus x berolinensis]
MNVVCRLRLMSSNDDAYKEAIVSDGKTKEKGCRVLDEQVSLAGETYYIFPRVSRILADRSLSQLVIKDKDKSQWYYALCESKPQVDIIEFE